MSWFPKSLINTFLPQPDQEQEPEQEQQEQSAEQEEENGENLIDNRGRGVKEDLTELTKTITRQLWSVATFLAPLPEKDPTFVSEEFAEDSQKFVGIRNDFSDIGGSFKSGVSGFTALTAVNEISRLASSFLQFQGVDEVEESEEFGENYDCRSVVFGITEEVLAFVSEISMHPETWLDFPLLVVDKNFDNFEMSDAQQAHASAIEWLALGLAARRAELCPSHMNEACFWKIYFVLLHPRLNKSDSEVLLTPQIMEARGLMLQEQQNRTRTWAQSSVTAPSVMDNVSATDLPCIDMLENVVDQPLEENREMGSPCSAGKQQFGNEEDVSFSDLEGDNDGSSGKTSPEPLQDSQHSRARKSASEESGGDWVNVNEFDFDTEGSL